MRTVSRPHTAVAAGGRRRSGPFSFERPADRSRRQRPPRRASGQLLREPALTSHAAAPPQPTSRASRLRRSGARASRRPSPHRRPSRPGSRTSRAPVSPCGSGESPRRRRGRQAQRRGTARSPPHVLDQPGELRLVVGGNERSGDTATLLRCISPLGGHGCRSVTCRRRPTQADVAERRRTPTGRKGAPSEDCRNDCRAAPVRVSNSAQPCA